jgi:hypothetical protein
MLYSSRPLWLYHLYDVCREIQTNDQLTTLYNSAYWISYCLHADQLIPNLTTLSPCIILSIEFRIVSMQTSFFPNLTTWPPCIILRIEFRIISMQTSFFPIWALDHPVSYCILNFVLSPCRPVFSQFDHLTTLYNSEYWISYYLHADQLFPDLTTTHESLRRCVP